jgi:enoyl-CoA hydratase/carnithine racemase
MSDVRVETDGAITTIWLNRPDRRNAVDGPMASALLRAFEEFENDPARRVAVLAGAGGTFCAGADLTAVGDPSRRNALDPGGEGPGPMGPTRMALSKPLIDGGTARLPRIVGLGRALDLILTGRPVTVGEAYGMGLATLVAAPGRGVAEGVAGVPIVAREGAAGAARFVSGEGRHGRF